MPRCAATLEYLDDDHAPTATWAWMRGWLGLTVIRTAGVGGLPGRLWDVEQLTGASDVPGPAAIGEQAVMADAVEPAGQHVDEEAADELVDGECHHFGPLLLLGAIILPFESNPGIVERDDAAVGDGDTVGVARQVGQHRSSMGRRNGQPVRVDHPLGPA